MLKNKNEVIANLEPNTEFYFIDKDYVYKAKTLVSITNGVTIEKALETNKVSIVSKKEKIFDYYDIKDPDNEKTKNVKHFATHLNVKTGALFVYTLQDEWKNVGGADNYSDKKDVITLKLETKLDNKLSQINGFIDKLAPFLEKQLEYNKQLTEFVMPDLDKFAPLSVKAGKETYVRFYGNMFIKFKTQVEANVDITRIYFGKNGVNLKFDVPEDYSEDYIYVTFSNLEEKLKIKIPVRKKK